MRQSKNNFLIHSDGSAELYHWKYIDKKMVNGKWRYTYEKTKAPGVKNKIIDALGYDEKAAYDNAQMLSDYHKQVNSSLKDYGSDIADIHQNQELQKDAERIRDKALHDYKKTPLYLARQAREAIQNGKNVINSFLKRTFRR